MSNAIQNNNLYSSPENLQRYTRDKVLISDASKISNLQTPTADTKTHIQNENTKSNVMIDMGKSPTSLKNLLEIEQRLNKTARNVDRISSKALSNPEGIAAKDMKLFLNSYNRFETSKQVMRYELGDEATDERINRNIPNYQADKEQCEKTLSHLSNLFKTLDCSDKKYADTRNIIKNEDYDKWSQDTIESILNIDRRINLYVENSDSNREDVMKIAERIFGGLNESHIKHAKFKQKATEEIEGLAEYISSNRLFDKKTIELSETDLKKIDTFNDWLQKISSDEGKKLYGHEEKVMEHALKKYSIDYDQAEGFMGKESHLHRDKLISQIHKKYVNNAATPEDAESVKEFLESVQEISNAQIDFDQPITDKEEIKMVIELFHSMEEAKKIIDPETMIEVEKILDIDERGKEQCKEFADIDKTYNNISEMMGKNPKEYTSNEIKSLIEVANEITDLKNRQEHYILEAVEDRHGLGNREIGKMMKNATHAMEKWKEGDQEIQSFLNNHKA